MARLRWSSRRGPFDRPTFDRPRAGSGGGIRCLRRRDPPGRHRRCYLQHRTPPPRAKRRLRPRLRGPSTFAGRAIRTGDRPPPSGEPPSDNPPNTTPPKIDPPGEEPTPPEDGSGGHPCEATVSVSYGTSAAAALSRTSAGTALSADPSVATISLDWGDGTSTTQTVAWGSAMTVTHNYYYSTSPYPRLAPGQGSDGDPQGDGSDEYPLQATVLETGARSFRSVVPHRRRTRASPGGWRCSRRSRWRSHRSRAR